MMARKKKQFAISSSHSHPTSTATMTLTVVISVMLLLPFHYIPQFAWSQQPQEPAQDNAYTRAQTEHVQVGDILRIFQFERDK